MTQSRELWEKVTEHRLRVASGILESQFVIIIYAIEVYKECYLCYMGVDGKVPKKKKMLPYSFYDRKVYR